MGSNPISSTMADSLPGRGDHPSRAPDDEALLVVRLAARFLELGVDARHLRMFLVGAQREAGVLEQALLPRVRDDDRSRRQVRSQLDELVEAGSRLRELLLRRSLGGLGD